MQMFIGIIIGIVISAVGFTGIASILDRGVSTIKEASQTVAK